MIFVRLFDALLFFFRSIYFVAVKKWKIREKKKEKKIKTGDSVSAMA